MGILVLDRAAKLQHVEKLVASSTLQGSESLCNLLRYLAKQSLDHPGTAIKEYQIATEVFGRSADFDPRLDSTVRVQTGRLRSKLVEYYANGGVADQIVVEIPRGSYGVTFRFREPGAAARHAAPAPQLPPEEVKTRISWSLVAIIASSVITIVAAVAYSLKPGWIGTAPVEPAGALHAFWQPFLEGPEPPLVVYSNAAFVGRPETGLRYFNPSTDRSQAILDHYTGVGEVMAIHELDNLFAAFRRPIHIKRGRLLTWDDAKTSNLIFIGSPSENLSLREIPGTEDFVFKVRSAEPRRGDLSIVNAHPRPGEQAVYFATPDPPIRDDYAVIGLIPGLGATRMAMILAGITTLGTQAAVEFVSRPKRIEELLAQLTGSTTGPAVPFEALLRVKVSGGVPVETDVVALRARHLK